MLQQEENRQQHRQDEEDEDRPLQIDSLPIPPPPTTAPRSMPSNTKRSNANRSNRKSTKSKSTKSKSTKRSTTSTKSTCKTTTRLPLASLLFSGGGAAATKQVQDEEEDEEEEEEAEEEEEEDEDEEEVDAHWDQYLAALVLYKKEHHTREPPISYSVAWTDAPAAVETFPPTPLVDDAGEVADSTSALQKQLQKQKQQAHPDDASAATVNTHAAQTQKPHKRDGRSKGGMMQLGKWCCRQRSLKSNLSGAKRLPQLNEIGFEWNPAEASWSRHVRALKQYKQTHDGRDPLVEYVLPNGDRGRDMRLGIWCMNQKEAKKKNKLKVEKIAELDQLGIEWRTIWYDALALWILPLCVNCAVP
jgi:hypothetical protein